MVIFLLFSFLFNFLYGDEEYCSTEENAKCEVFEITLEWAINQALTANRQLANSYEALEKATLTLGYSLGEFELKITPNGQLGYAGGGTLGTGASYGTGLDLSRKFQTGTKISVSPMIFQVGKHWRNDIKGTFTQPLLKGFGREYNLSSYRSAQFGYRSAIRNLYIAEVQLIVKTVQALYEVVKQENTYLLNKESYDRIAGYFETAKIKEKVGLSDALDVNRAELELKSAEEALSAAYEKLQDSKDTLRDLLSLPADCDFIIIAPLHYSPVDLPTPDAIDFAIENRIEVFQAKDKLCESFRLSWMAKKNLLPELNLVVNYATCGQHELFTRCIRERESTWGVGFSTSGDYARCNEKLAYEQSLIAIENAERGIEQIQESIALEVKKAIRTLEKSMKNIQLQTEKIHTAEGGLYLSKLKFQRGLADNFNVIQSEKTLKTAQISLLTNVIEYITGEYQLLAALGMLADRPAIP